MGKIILLMIFLGSLSNLRAQSFTGFLTDNYAGINSVVLNPAHSVDSRFMADVHLVGMSAFLANDYYNMHAIKDLKDDGYYRDSKSRFTPKTHNNGGANIDVMGPSFMLDINNNHAIAIFTRARSFVNGNGINGRDLQVIDEELLNDFIVNEDYFNVFAQAWAEIGFSYASVLIHKRENFLKGGVSLKYLQGAGSAYLGGSDIFVSYDEDGALHSNGGTTGSFTSTGHVVYGRFDDFDNANYEYQLPKSARGLGLDIGIIYEWRPNYSDYRARKVWPNRLTYKDQNKYKLKLGVSITDMGYILYRKGTEAVFDIANTNVSSEAIDNEDGLYDVLNNLYTLTNTSIGYKAKLPTALHLNADWSFTNRLYVNFNTDLSLRAKNRLDTSAIINMASLTPRFESKWFSVYMPLSVVQYVGFQAGAGFRLGPLYMGSSSLFTNLLNERSKGTHFYGGLKIPFFYGKYDKGSRCDCY